MEFMITLLKITAPGEAQAGRCSGREMLRLVRQLHLNKEFSVYVIPVLLSMKNAVLHLAES